MKTLAVNKRAGFDYELLDRYDEFRIRLHQGARESLNGSWSEVMGAASREIVSS